jgi:DNA-directed RNA polymerase subunit L/DNA-directed RNA polymerase alpha subunit
MVKFRNFHYNADSNKTVFEIEDLSLSLINGIRRTMMTYVENVSMIGEEGSTIVIEKNTGPLNNEIIAHRLCMIPIHLSEQDIDEYDNENPLKLTLDESNSKNEMKNVTSNHFKGTYKGKELTSLEMEKLFPKNPISNDYILITRLRKKESLKLEATAVKRAAEHHACFSPVSLCNYYFKEVSNSKETGILQRQRDFIKNEYQEPKNVIFQIESVNAMSAKYLFGKSIQKIIERLQTIRYEMSNDSPTSKIEIVNFNNIENCYDFNCKDEDDTLGNIIQSYIHEEYVRTKKIIEGDKVCSFAGYYCPHPLEKKMCLRIVIENETNEESFRDFFINSCGNIINKMNEISAIWNNT